MYNRDQNQSAHINRLRPHGQREESIDWAARETTLTHTVLTMVHSATTEDLYASYPSSTVSLPTILKPDPFLKIVINNDMANFSRQTESRQNLRICCTVKSTVSDPAQGPCRYLTKGERKSSAPDSGVPGMRLEPPNWVSRFLRATPMRSDRSAAEPLLLPP
jgi:hypothetical protein